MKSSRLTNAFFAWIIFGICAAYLILPLATQFAYSLRAKRNEISFQAYTNIVQVKPGEAEFSLRPLKIKLPRFYSALLFSTLMAALTIVASIVIIVPTTYWAHYKLPRLKPVLDFFSVIPFAIPGIVLVFGYLRTYSAPPFSLTNTEVGTGILLVGGYVVFVLPYTYRTIDIGLRAIDVSTLTEAARSLGAGWGTVIFNIILPNLRSAILSASLLTFAVAIGEYTLANFLFPDERAFGSYIFSIGQNKIFEPAALTIMSFALVWVCVLLINRFGRGANTTMTIR
jgi:putative spermidine/putrescine transport system permease protein